MANETDILKFPFATAEVKIVKDGAKEIAIHFYRPNSEP